MSDIYSILLMSAKRIKKVGALYMYKTNTSLCLYVILSVSTGLS